MTEQSPECTNPTPHITLVAKPRTEAERTALIISTPWVSVMHGNVLAERDALRNEVAQLEPLLQEAAAIARENRSRVVELEVENARLQQMLDAVGAGGVEPLRKRECLHQIAQPAASKRLSRERIKEIASWFGMTQWSK